ncbi:MAG: alpha/beta fold hydrolase [Candidatus Micrarchaeaceae archaeon]
MDIKTDFEDRHFDSKYGKLHYVHHEGSGPAVVFLHGFAGSLKSWTRLMQHLPHDLDVYAVDLLGHGDSDAPDADYSLKMHYETIRGLIEEQGLANPYLFGHSYGGWVAAHYALEEKIGGLILEDSAGLEEFAYERHARDPNYREEMVKKALSINPREDVLKKMMYADNTDVFLTPSALGSIEARTMIIWGGDDSTVDVKYAKVFSKSIIGSRLIVLEGEKHTPHYTNPEAVAKALIDFLAVFKP